MTVHPRQILTRAIVGLLGLTVASSTVLAGGAGHAASSDPKYRKVSAPDTFYPLYGGRAVKDLGTYGRRHRGTDIAAPCGATVRASHPGIAKVRTSTAWGGRYVVRIISNRNGLVTQYGFLTRPLVVDGQIMQSGQPVGILGANPSSRKCALYFTVSGGGRTVNPSTWLFARVGKPAPVRWMFDSRGITVASFNVLGASHTRGSSRFATFPGRMNRAAALFESRHLDVVGLQEFQEVQNDYFMPRWGSTWGIYHYDPPGNRRDTENAIVWRQSTMEFVSGETFDIPYFNGNIRHVPAVLLRERATGRTAWFLNVHNPADVRGKAARYRARAIAIERAKIIALRATGRPVFLTGDFNDRQAAFCPLTAGKLAISPNSIPSMGCAYPRQSSIDWIFAAGQARFSSFTRDTYPQGARISDHPLVYAQAHLQD